MQAHRLSIARIYLVLLGKVQYELRALAEFREPNLSLDLVQVDWPHEFAAAIELNRLRAEIAALRDLVAQAHRVRDHAADSKLTALKECLARAEFQGLIDGRGKLPLFTEHRATLVHLRENLERWGYSTARFMGHEPHQRRHAVIAFARGGATENVEDSRIGILFGVQTAESLIQAPVRREKVAFQRAQLRASAMRFGRGRFSKEFSGLVARTADRGPELVRPLNARAD